jgi:tetratricopeptide (TPR) repeat protein
MMPARAGWLGAALAAGAVAVAALVPAMRHRIEVDPARVTLRAQADYQAGRYERAAAGLELLASLRAPTPMDRMARALVARARGRPEDALAELGRIPRDHRLRPMAELLAGQIERDRGQLRAAEARFLAAVEHDPPPIEAYAELAYIYNLQRRVDEMDRQFEALDSRGALTYDQLVHWGKTRNGIWSPAKDCEALERIVAADPGDRRSRLALADGFRQMSELDAAAAALAPLPESDPEALARRAMIAVDRGEPDRARRLLERGPADDPGLARLRGQLALKRGDARAVAEAFRIARAAEPGDRP